MVKSFDKLVSCPICGRKHTLRQHKMMTRKSGKQRKYKGGYRYNTRGDKSFKGEDVTYSSIGTRTRSSISSGTRSRSSTRRSSTAYGKKKHNKSYKIM
jgi:hypothetical protein